MAATQWQLSYWDGLEKDHPDCLEAARRVGQVILKSKERPNLCRENMLTQSAIDCGFRAIYWAEELCRRKRGEGCWTVPYNISDQVDRVQKFVNKVRDD